MTLFLVVERALKKKREREKRSRSFLQHLDFEMWRCDAWCSGDHLIIVKRKSRKWPLLKNKI